MTECAIIGKSLNTPCGKKLKEEVIFLEFPQQGSEVCTKDLDEQEYTVLKELLEIYVDLLAYLKWRMERV